MMYSLKFEQDEFDTLFESISTYITHCQSQIKIYQGQQNLQNYWINEFSLSNDLLEKLKKEENESEGS